jgi:pimeloyl-ACP methyl ester carboxylesterase
MSYYRPLYRAASALLSLLTFSAGVAEALPAANEKPTIVLIHGAMADASSWDEVIPKLQSDGYRVIAAPNPLRGLKSDSDYVSGLLRQIPGRVILVGHSYGGAIITNAANGNGNVKGLVYVAAFAPDAGESAFDLVGKNPGSTLGAALAAPVPLSAGGNDLYVKSTMFKEPFAADLPERRVRILAATQRPVTDIALEEPASAPAWKTLPAWFIYGDADKSIPPATQQFMAQRSHAREIVVLKGGSHMIMVSQATAVVRLIERAANSGD